MCIYDILNNLVRLSKLQKLDFMLFFNLRKKEQLMLSFKKI